MFCCSNKKGLSASVVDGALVVSQLSGDAPRIWRGDIKHVSSAVLEIEGNSLVIAREDGKSETIAAFSKKGEALKALLAVNDALTCGHHKKKSHWVKRLLKTVFVLFALALIALWLLTKVAALAPQQAAQQLQSAPQQSTPQTGVPVPADQLLGK